MSHRDMNREEKRRLFGANLNSKRIVTWNGWMNTEVLKPISCKEINNQIVKEGLEVNFLEKCYEEVFKDYSIGSQGIADADILAFKRNEYAKTPLNWLKQFKKIVLYSIDETIDIFNIRDIKGCATIKQIELYTTGMSDGEVLTEYKWSMLIDISSFPFKYTVWRESDRPKEPSESFKEYAKRPHFKLVSMNQDIYTQRLCEMTAQLLIVSSFLLSYTGFIKLDEKCKSVTMLPLIRN